MRELYTDGSHWLHTGHLFFSPPTRISGWSWPSSEIFNLQCWARTFCIFLTLIKSGLRYAVGVYLAAELFLFLYLLRWVTDSHLSKLFELNFFLPDLWRKNHQETWHLNSEPYLLDKICYINIDPFKTLFKISIFWQYQLGDVCFRYINMNLFEIKNSSIFHKFPSVDCQAIKEERWVLWAIKSNFLFNLFSPVHWYTGTVRSMRRVFSIWSTRPLTMMLLRSSMTVRWHKLFPFYLLEDFQLMIVIVTPGFLCIFKQCFFR